MGVNRCMPQAVVHGPRVYQGLNLPNLYLEQMLIHIQMLVKFGQHTTDATGILVRACGELPQLELGTFSDFSSLLPMCNTYLVKSMLDILCSTRYWNRDWYIWLPATPHKWQGNYEYILEHRIQVRWVNKPWTTVNCSCKLFFSWTAATERAWWLTINSGFERNRPPVIHIIGHRYQNLHNTNGCYGNKD